MAKNYFYLHLFDIRLLIFLRVQICTCLPSYFGMVIILNLANFMGNQFASHFTDFEMECFFTELKSFEEKSEKSIPHHKIMKSNKLYITLLKKRSRSA